MALPLPLTVQLRYTGTAPAGTLYVSANRLPDKVPLIVPVAGMFADGFSTVAAPETAAPVCIATHVIRSADPEPVSPTLPDHVPDRFSIADGLVELPHDRHSSAETMIRMVPREQQ